jgi:peptidylamidoglycolate lyase
MKRRSFISGVVVSATGFSVLHPFNIIIAKDKKLPVIGHGDFRYRVNTRWGILDARTPVKDCHEMVMDKKKRIFLLTNETKSIWQTPRQLGQQVSRGAWTYLA